MRCVDVNVLLYAHRADLPEHEAYKDVLERMANDEEPLGLVDAVLAGYLRIITNRRVFVDPTPAAEAWARIEALLAAPAAVMVRPGEHHWDHFRRLADRIDARGNDIADAFLAAYAVELRATWVSADRGFARFPGLQWQHPLD